MDLTVTILYGFVSVEFRFPGFKLKSVFVLVKVYVLPKTTCWIITRSSFIQGSRFAGHSSLFWEVKSEVSSSVMSHFISWAFWNSTPGVFCPLITKVPCSNSRGYNWSFYIKSSRSVSFTGNLSVKVSPEALLLNPYTEAIQKENKKFPDDH